MILKINIGDASARRIYDSGVKDFTDIEQHIYLRTVRGSHAKGIAKIEEVTKIALKEFEKFLMIDAKYHLRCYYCRNV